MVLFSNMVCFVLIIVFWVQVCWFLTWQWLFLNKKSDKSMFLFSNMVCFVLIIVFWFLFFSSNLLVSHFKMFVFKQQKYQTRARFCFRTCFFVLTIVFWVQVCWFITWKWLFLNKKYQTRACFCFRTWFVLFWLLCFDFCFSVQVCLFLISRWLLLNEKTCQEKCMFCLWICFVRLFITF